MDFFFYRFMKENAKSTIGIHKYVLDLDSVPQPFYNTLHIFATIHMTILMLYHLGLIEEQFVA